MTKTINTALRTALVLGITLGAAGGMTAISAPMTATQAQAFGLGDITGAAKNAAKRVAKDVGNSAKIVGGGVKDAANYVGKGVKENAKDFGSALERDARKVGSGIADNAKDFGGALKRDLKPLEPIGRKIGNGAKTVGDAIKRCTIGVPKGECGHEFKPPVVKPGLVSALERDADKITSRLPVQGITKQNLKPGTSAFKGTKNASRMDRKRTTLRNTVVPDRSLTGLTLDGKKLPRRGARPIQRPRPITENDIKPSKPFCNSKFENCSGKHSGRDHDDKKGKHSKKGKSNKHSSRNNKHDDRRFRIKHHDNKEHANRRSNNKNSSGGSSKRRHVQNFNGGSSRQHRNRR